MGIGIDQLNLSELMNWFFEEAKMVQANKKIDVK
jgi:hypothetical protein